MPSEFEADTQVDGKDGHYEVAITERWSIGDRPNGGYLQAIVGRAMGLEVPQPDVISSTAHFLSPAEPGPATVEVEVLKRGRSLSNTRAKLLQSGQVKVTVIAIHGDLDGSGRTRVFASAPALKHPTPAFDGSGPFAINQRFDYLVEPALMEAFTRDPPPAARPEITGRIRFRDEHLPDSVAFPLLVDAFPPTMFLLGLLGWTPTLELTVHGRGRPTSHWLTARLRAQYLIGGFFEEDCELWDESGQLVAQSRQLGKVIV